MSGSIRSMGVDLDFFLSRFGGVARRVCILAVVVVVSANLSSEAFGQRRHGPSPLDTLGDNPSQEDGWEVLRKFRTLGIAGDYSFRFQLKIMPRREKTTTVPGVLYGSMNELGPVTRVDVALSESTVDDHANLVQAKVLRLLLQNGVFAKAYESEDDVNDGAPQMIDSEQCFDPIAGSDFTVFDLLMPYIYWQRFVYEGRTTFRGRPTHVFWLYPPKEDEALAAKMSGVRVFLDEEFYALIQAEIYDPKKELAKTVTIVDFKKVADQWILNQVDVRDEATRDKTRFKVVDANMNLDLPDKIFTLQALTTNVYGADISEVAASMDSSEPTKSVSGSRTARP